MAITNKERVGRALDSLKEGLYPFVEREMRSVYNEHWENHALGHLYEDRTLKRTTAERLQQDVADLINVIFGEWHNVFKKTLGNAERNLIGELKIIRNDWAHGNNFSSDDAYRALKKLESITPLIISKLLFWWEIKSLPELLTRKKMAR